MTLWLSRIMSWAALATEALLPVLLLSPVQRVCDPAGRDRLRSSACTSGSSCFINLGVFSWAMIGYTPFLLTAADWDAVRAAGARAAGGG